MIEQSIRDEYFQLVDSSEHSKPTAYKVSDLHIKFCEKYPQFMEVYIACKFQFAAFYGYMKANGDIEKLKKAVDIVNERAENME